MVCKINQYVCSKIVCDLWYFVCMDEINALESIIVLADHMVERCCIMC